jgi:hypothetical protein
VTVTIGYCHQPTPENANTRGAVDDISPIECSGQKRRRAVIGMPGHLILGLSGQNVSSARAGSVPRAAHSDGSARVKTRSVRGMSRDGR